MPIKVLDKKLVAQIAAGEVVERPASVVKELVENSLDAGSSQIAVEAKGGGVTLIRVTDNGAGISGEDVELAFERYATSKIGSLTDLQSIHSLGFRGEALPSIASVAQVEVVTCPAGEAAGTYLDLEDGVVTERKKQGRPQGTTITVRNLFGKVPARLKFLKSTSTENSHIANVVSQYALAFPEVGFTLFIDGRKALRTSGRGQLLDSIVEIYGVETASRMLEVKGAEWESGILSPQATGMVGSPQVSRSSRGYLSFFVNRRWVNSRLLTWAVAEAYHGLLMTGKHPVAVINLSLPPEVVDVNIHPTKSEVKFQNERQVFGAVQKAVRETLVGQMPVPGIEEVATAYMSPSGQGQALRAAAPSSSRVTTPPPEAPQMMTSLPVLRVLGQLANSYIVAEGPDGLYLIDQHAAHERILFEKVNDQRRQHTVEVQGLLEPVPFEVSPKQGEVLQAHGEDLAEFGFSVEPFGDKTYVVRAVPHVLGNADWLRMLKELLESFSGESAVDWEEKVATSIACHGAIKVGKTLSAEEMRELVRQLEQAATPHTCPHGRPTMIQLSSGQLRREFGRS